MLDEATAGVAHPKQVSVARTNFIERDITDLNEESFIYARKERGTALIFHLDISGISWQPQAKQSFQSPPPPPPPPKRLEPVGI